jgi:hypothetical protein
MLTLKHLSPLAAAAEQEVVTTSSRGTILHHGNFSTSSLSGTAFFTTKSPTAALRVRRPSLTRHTLHIHCATW